MQCAPSPSSTATMSLRTSGAAEADRVAGHGRIPARRATIHRGRCGQLSGCLALNLVVRAAWRSRPRPLGDRVREVARRLPDDRRSSRRSSPRCWRPSRPGRADATSSAAASPHRQKQQMDRRGERSCDPARDERAVGEKRRVQRRESVPIGGRDARQVRLRPFVPAGPRAARGSRHERRAGRSVERTTAAAT